MCSRSCFVRMTPKGSKAKKGDVQVELYIYNLDLNHEKLLLVLQKNEQFHISSIIFILDSFICSFSKKKKKKTRINASLNMMFAIAKKVILNLSIMTQ